MTEVVRKKILAGKKNRETAGLAIAGLNLQGKKKYSGHFKYRIFLQNCTWKYMYFSSFLCLLVTKNITFFNLIFENMLHERIHSFTLPLIRLPLEDSDLCWHWTAADLGSCNKPKNTGKSDWFAQDWTEVSKLLSFYSSFCV